MWLKSKETGRIVLSNEIHNSEEFSRQVIVSSGEDLFKEGQLSNAWYKHAFEPLTEPMTIEISN